MRIDIDKYIKGMDAKVLEQIGWIGKPGPKFYKWLRSHSLPKDLLNFYDKYTPKKNIYVGSLTLCSSTDTMKWNDKDSACISNGLLIIGSACNGDLVAIDFTLGNGATGYIDHEELWDPKPSIPRKIFIPVACSLGQFAYKCDSDPDFPDYYWGAKKYVK